MERSKVYSHGHPVVGGSYNCGFTLVELMVTVAVMVIVSTVAIPSFADLIERNRIRTTRDLVIQSLHQAQENAVATTSPAFVCPTIDGNSCTGDWASATGLLAYLSRVVPNNGFTPTEEQLLNRLTFNGRQIIVNNDSANSFIRFASNGLVINSQITFCGRRSSVRDLRINVNRTGKVQYEEPAFNLCL